MNTQSLSKTDFIKFNISPILKTQVEKKAQQYGMTVSELGRMLFGGFVTGIIHPHSEISQSFLDLAKQAKKDYEAGKGVTFDTAGDAIKYLDSV